MPARCRSEPASGVPGSEDRPFDSALCQHPSGRRSVARGDEGRGDGAPTVPLSQNPRHAGPAGHRDEPEEAGRLYREKMLQVRRRGGRKRALGTRRPMLVPDRANARWSLDFASDTFTNGRRFRVLAVVDDYTRECLTLITSLSGLRVARELDATIRWRGRPDTTSMAVLRWCNSTSLVTRAATPVATAILESSQRRS